MSKQAGQNKRSRGRQPGAARRQSLAAKPDLQIVLAELKRRDAEEILTTGQAVELTGFTQQSFYNWIKRSVNPLKASKPGREHQIRVGDLYEFLQKRDFREGDSDEAGSESSRAAEAGGSVHPARLLRLQPTPSHARLQIAPRQQDASESPAASLLASINTRAAAFTMIERLIILAEVALIWRRSLLTTQAAEVSQDKEWLARCENETIRAQEALFDISSWTSNTMLEALYRALHSTIFPTAQLKAVGPEMSLESLVEMSSPKDSQADNAFLSHPDFRALSELFADVFRRQEWQQ